MAKKTKSIVFSNAVIDLNDGTITEFKKDSEIVSSLDEVLRAWEGIPGICLSIRLDEQCAVGADNVE